MKTVSWTLIRLNIMANNEKILLVLSKGLWPVGSVKVSWTVWYLASIDLFGVYCRGTFALVPSGSCQTAVSGSWRPTPQILCCVLWAWCSDHNPPNVTKPTGQRLTVQILDILYCDSTLWRTRNGIFFKGHVNQVTWFESYSAYVLLTDDKLRQKGKQTNIAWKFLQWRCQSLPREDTGDDTGDHGLQLFL